MEITELLAFFPSSGHNPGLPVSREYCDRNNIEYDMVVDQFYIPPSFDTEMAATDAEASFALLISAPAAVGKTTFARYLQKELRYQNKHVLYVPLKGRKIGDEFFKGLLSGVFCFSGSTMPQVLEELTSGRLVIIFDGYDEVTMTTDQMELNKRFTAEIGGVLGSKGGRVNVPAVLFLFRSVFYDFGIFDPIEESATRVRINYFDGDKRRAYLNGYLNQKTGDRFSNPRVAGQFLEDLDKRLGIASTGYNPSAFFGHALVLSSFGDFIIEEDEPNLIKLANNLGSDSVESSISLRILHPIIKKIIEREEGKLDSRTISDKLPSINGFPPLLQETILSEFAYAISIQPPQTTWQQKYEVISKLSEDHLESDEKFEKLPATDQQEIRKQYKELVFNQFEHHPFVDSTNSRFTNQIYHEFYLAKYLIANPRAAVNLIFENHKSASYFLGLFLLDQIPGGDISNYPELVHYIVTLLSMACNGGEYSVEIALDKSTNKWVGSLKCDAVSVPDFRISGEILDYRVQPGNIIQNVDFSGKREGFLEISCAAATYEKRVEIRNSTIDVAEFNINVPFLIFDGVSIQCKRVSLSKGISQLEGCNTLTIGSGSDDEAVEILTLPGQEKLRPLLEESVRLEVDDIEQFKRKVCKVLLGFRKHGRSDYGMYELRHRNLATSFGRDQIASSIVDLFFSEEIFSRQGGLLILHQERLSQYSAHYIQQNDLQFKDGGDSLYAKWREFA